MISAELVHGILRQRRSTSTELLKLSGLGNHFGNTSVVFFTLMMPGTFMIS
jgi:hypothetical protein